MESCSVPERQDMLETLKSSLSSSRDGFSPSSDAIQMRCPWDKEGQLNVQDGGGEFVHLTTQNVLWLKNKVRNSPQKCK